MSEKRWRKWIFIDFSLFGYSSKYHLPAGTAKAMVNRIFTCVALEDDVSTIRFVWFIISIDLERRNQLIINYLFRIELIILFFSLSSRINQQLSNIERRKKIDQQSCYHSFVLFRIRHVFTFRSTSNRERKKRK